MSIPSLCVSFSVSAPFSLSLSVPLTTPAVADKFTPSNDLEKDLEAILDQYGLREKDAHKYEDLEASERVNREAVERQ